MGIISKLLSRSKANSTGSASQPSSINDNVYGSYYRGSTEHNLRDYLDNIWDNASALAKSFALAEPYLADTTGRKLAKKSNVIDRIYAPLEGMSGYVFREMLALMTLSHDDFYILIHSDKDDDFTSEITPDQVAGFEIIQAGQVMKLGGNYHITTSKQIVDVSKKRLMHMIGMRNPYDLSQGYSPMRAVRKWATLDDFIIDYQQGLFVNGAVPAGIFNITATKADYESIVCQIKATMHNNFSGGVMFNHIPISASGQTIAPTIQWVPLSSTNKQLSTTDLMSSNSKKIDGYFGVPAEIKGYLQNSNYASVRVAEYVMVEYGVRPLAMSIWDSFTNELVRCVGDFGGVIAFELDSPIIADEEKVKADADTVNLNNLFSLMDKGYSAEQATSILGLPDRYLELANLPQPNTDPTPTEEATASKKEVKSKVALPYFDQSKINSTISNEIIRNAAIESQRAIVEAAIDGVEVDQDSLIAPLGYYYYDDTPTGEHKEGIKKFVIDHMDDILLFAGAITLYRSGKADIKSANKFLKELSAEFSFEKYTAGDQKVARLVDEWIKKPTAKLREAAIGAIKVSKSDMLKAYRTHINRLSSDYTLQTAQEIRRRIDKAIKEGASKLELTKRLEQLGLEDYRAKRLADTEIHYARNNATLDIAKQIEAKTGRRLTKTAIHDGTNTPCPFCTTQIGRILLLDEAFVKKNTLMIGVDGKARQNSYQDIMTANFHPNCRCKMRIQLAA